MMLGRPKEPRKRRNRRGRTLLVEARDAHTFLPLYPGMMTPPAKEQICSEVVAPGTYKEVTNETGFGDGRRDGLFQPGFG
jgi:hypothetical protein